MSKFVYQRILLKLSGEALLGDHQYGIDPKIANMIARQVKKVAELGMQIGVVIGGGNIFRGYKASTEDGMDRATADYMGMLATVMNALALEDAFKKEGVDTRVQSAIEMPRVAESYTRKRAIRHLEKGRVVIFAAGTGNPYFSTDTAAALRALEIGADILMKATKVGGVYDKDPKLDKNAKLYPELSYKEIMEKDLKVMDMAAIGLAMEHKLPILVFNLFQEDNILKASQGEQLGSIINS